MKFIDKFDPDLYPIVEGHELVELIFSNDTSSPLVDDFEEWVLNGVEIGEIEARQKSYSDNLGLGNFDFCRDSFFQWIHSKNILQKIQEKGVEIDKRVLEWVERYSQKKSQPSSPSPKTRRAGFNYLKEQFKSLGPEIIKRNKLTQPKQLIVREEIKIWIENSGLQENRPKDSFLIKCARSSFHIAGTKPKPGRPKKTS